MAIEKFQYPQWIEVICNEILHNVALLVQAFQYPQWIEVICNRMTTAEMEVRFTFQYPQWIEVICNNEKVSLSLVEMTGFSILNGSKLFVTIDELSRLTGLSESFSILNGSKLFVTLKMQKK